jgi:alpha-galactosidase
VLYLKQDATSAPAPYVAPPESPPAIAPAQDLLQPAIHGARVVGATPGRPLMFRIPATGQPPLRYEASGLPAGLRLDKDTGIISGSIRDRGESQVALTVRGPHGIAHRSPRIVGSDDALVRTPPMGWNSWSAWGPTVDAPAAV